MNRWAGLLGAWWLLAPGSAAAAGKLLGHAAPDPQITQARVAFVQGPTRSAAWYQLRFAAQESSELLWLLPLPAGVTADVAARSFFDALDDATAPRILPPPGSPPKGAGCVKPKAVSVGPGDSFSWSQLLDHEVLTAPDAVASRLGELGYGLDGPDLTEVEQSLASGGRVLLLRMDLPVAEGTTVTVRLSGKGGTLEGLPWLRAGAEPVPVSLWLLGDGRGKAGGLKELEVLPSTLRWTGLAETSYGQIRDELLTKAQGGALVVEAAGQKPLREGSLLSSGELIKPLVEAYVQRAFERSEATSDASLDVVRAALKGAVPEPCPRGDLAAASPPACAPQPSPLSVGPIADDLAFVFAGSPSQRWVSRFAGLVPANQDARAVAPAFEGSDLVPMLYTPAPVWEGLCSSSPTTGGGGAPGGGGPSGSGSYSSGSASQVPAGGSSGEEEEDDDSAVAIAATQAACSCASVFVDSGCSSSSSEGSDSGCGSSEEGASDSGCGCGDSSSEGGDSCSGSDSGGESCSGSEGSSGGDACGSSSSGGSSCGKDCSVGRGGRRPTRPSRWVMLLAALALPVRRATRPRARDRRER